jgi:enamine deaminase RidA (YjgF/YER057c/UK114 family)
MTIEEKLVALNLSLPILPKSKGIYKRCLQVDNLLYVSGHISVNNDGSYLAGKLGDNMSDEDGKKAARQSGLAILSSLREELGGFEKIKRVVKLFGMVNATPGFEKHAIVINGCSELFVELWGEENGKGVRSAVGMGSLPFGVAVEIEAIFELNLVAR